MRGLLIQQFWLDKIFQGKKTWEIRGSNTHIRGRIGLIESGSGLVKGTCDLVDVIGPLSLAELRENLSKHCMTLDDLREGSRYPKPFAWVLRDAKALRNPVPYKHPQGAVIWVKLGISVSRRLK
jgi:hypothetical protein